MEASRWRWGVALACLCLVALLPTLFGAFFADDYYHVERAEALGEALSHGWVLPIDQGGAWWTPPGLSVEYFRPMIVVAFAVDRLLYGQHAAGYHVTNLLLHVTTTLLVWGIARHVLGRGFAAWTAAALFAIHPAHTMAIGWISGRTDVLATMFFAAALFLYLESRVRSPAAPLALACVAFLLGILSKEMAITLPAIVLGHALLVPRGEPLAKRLVAPALLGALGVAYLAFRIRVLGGFHAPPIPFAFHAGDPGLAYHLVTSPFLYLADLVMFVPADPVATLPFWMAHPLVLAVFVAVIVATFVGTMKKAASRHVALWALGWLAVTILPVMMLTVGEHFLYLPSIGYCVLVGSQLPASPASIDGKQRRALAVVAAMVALVCFGRTAGFAWLSRGAETTIAQVVDAIDRAPQARRVLVADVPASAALAFPPAVRLARPDRPLQVEMLSLGARIVPDAADTSAVTFTGPDRFEVRRADGYLASYIERALEGSPRTYVPGDVVHRDGFDVTVLPGQAPARLAAFAVTLNDPADALVLKAGPGGVETLTAPR
jgi:hypothetical protein